MIERYTLPEMGSIWTQNNKYQKWLDVEIAVCEIQAKNGVIPDQAWKVIKEKAAFNEQRINEIEAEVHHDVIAFLTSVAEFIGPESRYVHLGMTSSDVLDTALSLQIKEAGSIIHGKLLEFRNVLKRRALEYKNTPCIGRSHGIHAEPMMFGLKPALWYDEMNRNIIRFEQALDMVCVGKISGAVGTFAHIDPKVEEDVCLKLGLKFAPVSTQVVQRDRHAHFLSTLAIIGATLEKIAVEIRHLQRTEVSEAAEFFSSKQKGSSAMPHKRNPIISERVSGLARLLRSYAMAGFENVALWHERDISHSSVERVILPDSTILMDYMLEKMIKLIDKLEVNPEKMKENLNLTNGLLFSQALMLALVNKGITREDAYLMVQKPSMQCWKSNDSMKNIVLSDDNITSHLTENEIKNCFDLDIQLRNVQYIYSRVGLV